MAAYVYSLKFSAKLFPVLESTIKCNDGSQITETVKIHGLKFAYKDHSCITDQQHNRICGPAERAWDAVEKTETPHGQLYAHVDENKFTDGAEVRIYGSHYASTTDYAMDHWQMKNGNHVVGHICKRDRKWVFIPNKVIDSAPAASCEPKPDSAGDQAHNDVELLAWV